MRRPVLFVLLATLAAIPGCGADDPPADRPGLALGPVELRGPPGSGQPYLFGGDGGPVLLTWLEPVGEGESGHALRIAERREGVWGDPRTVARRRAFFVNWADFPSATRLPDGTLLVHWLEKVEGGPYAYHVLASLSRDDGRTWEAPVRVHRDGSPTEHGFVSAVPWEDGAALVWLDGRAMAEAAGGTADGGAMTLRATTLSPRGALGEEALLDARTCECCATALARTASGLVAAYRDRGPEEVRDIHAVRFDGTRWTEPRPVHRDGWVIRGCPVNGPQLSARGDRVAVAWFTAPEGRPRVHVAFSGDGGATWGSPVRVDEGLPLGRVDLELLPDGSAAVAWIEAEDPAEAASGAGGTDGGSPADAGAGSGREGAGLLLRRVGPDGWIGTPLRVTRMDAARAAGFPRLARAGDDLLVAWTVPGPEGGIRVVRIRTPVGAVGPEPDPS